MSSEFTRALIRENQLLKQSLFNMNRFPTEDPLFQNMLPLATRITSPKMGPTGIDSEEIFTYTIPNFPFTQLARLQNTITKNIPSGQSQKFTFTSGEAKYFCDFHQKILSDFIDQHTGIHFWLLDQNIEYGSLNPEENFKMISTYHGNQSRPIRYQNKSYSMDLAYTVVICASSPNLEVKVECNHRNTGEIEEQ